jgi:cytochrome c oxidase subunit 2
MKHCQDRKRITSRQVIIVTGMLGLWWQFGINSSAAAEPKVVKITAKKYEFSPKQLILKKGETVTLQFTSLDRKHGFSAPALDIRADITPGKVTELKVTPAQVGESEYYCDVFCGSGHDDMTGRLKIVN